ncbi:hypothetical protein [Clostridium sp.]|uniref:hypothetical protein n=1 Tax=Clostridium sp. TaxID=1506 RepID=UPI00290DD40E|nr:hypothetical protein [Clostridium sp.]MDU4725911.1 hypothetical protein [Clostridium sp.]
MKKLNKYYINDGVDGVVVAKSLKQAINLIYPYYYNSYPKGEILEQCKNPKWENDWLIKDVIKVSKNKYKKSAVLGWLE